MMKKIFVTITVFTAVACGGDPNEMPEIPGPLNGGSAITGSCSVTVDGAMFSPPRTFTLTNATAVIVNGKTAVMCKGTDATFGRVEFGIAATGVEVGRPLALVPVIGNAGISITFPERTGADDLWVGRVNDQPGRPKTAGTMTLSSIGAPRQAIVGTFSAAPVYNGSNTASVTITGRFSARYEGSATFNNP